MQKVVDKLESDWVKRVLVFLSSTAFGCSFGDQKIWLLVSSCECEGVCECLWLFKAVSAYCSGGVWPALSVSLGLHVYWWPCVGPMCRWLYIDVSGWVSSWVSLPPSSPPGPGVVLGSPDCPRAITHHLSFCPQANLCSGALSCRGLCIKGKAARWGFPTTRLSSWRRSLRPRNTSPRPRGSVWPRCCSLARDRWARPGQALLGRASRAEERRGALCAPAPGALLSSFWPCGLLRSLASASSPPRPSGFWAGGKFSFSFSCRSKRGFRIDALNGGD